MKSLRTALGAACAALLAASLPACRADNAVGEALQPRDDRGGMAHVTSEQIGATNPGSEAEAGYARRNRGTRDQLTQGVTGSASGDVGSTANGASSNTLGSDKNLNGRTSMGNPAGPTAPERATPASNVSGQAAPPGAGEAPSAPRH